MCFIVGGKPWVLRRTHDVRNFIVFVVLRLDKRQKKIWRSQYNSYLEIGIDSNNATIKQTSTKKYQTKKEVETLPHKK